MLQNAPREHSAILSTFIKLPFVFKTFVLFIFEWPLKTDFTVFRSDGPVPVFSPIYYCNSTTFISTTAKSIKLITHYEKLVPLINFSVFFNALLDSF